VGGPAKATTVALPGACGVSFAAGAIYVGDSSAVRKVSGTGWLSTPAGTGTAGPRGDGGPAVKASFDEACGVVSDRARNLVIADTRHSRIRVVAAATGTFYGQAMTAGHIYTVAGNGTDGFAGDGGPATAAELAVPGAVAIDGQGNLVIADSFNNRIRVVAVATGTFYGQAMTARDIYTVAGNGTRGFSGDGGLATRAELYQPMATAVDGAGNTVIADSFNSRIRVVAAATGTFYGHAMTAGHIYTVAGEGTDGYSGDGGPATAAELYRPAGLGIDRAGNLLIGDTSNNRVRVVAERTGTYYGRAMTAGHIYTVAGDGQQGYAGDGGPATSAELYAPYAAAEDAKGNLVFADTGNDRVRVVASSTGRFYGRAMTTGHIYTVAGGGSGLGDGGPATHAFLQPGGIVVSAAGNLVVSDSWNERIRVVATSTGTFYGQPMTAGNIYTIAGNGTAGFSGDGGPATSAELNFPQDVSLDGARNLLIADTDNQRIRVVAEHTGTFYGQAMTAGDIYTVAGNGTAGFSGDGGPATRAGFTDPWVVTADHAGDLLISDAFDNRIRMVAG